MGGGSQSCAARRAAAHRRCEQGRTTARGGATQVMSVLLGPLTNLWVHARLCSLQCLPLSPSSPLPSPLSLLFSRFLSRILRVLSIHSFYWSPLNRPCFLSRPLSQTFPFLVPSFLYSSCLLFSFLPLWLSLPSLCSVV